MSEKKSKLDENEGIRAIIDLQKLAGVDEPIEKATEGWRKMSEYEKQSTMNAYKTLCASKPKKPAR